MSNYWQKRMIRSHDELQKRSVKQTEAQLAKYYSQTMKRVIADMEALYDKLRATMEEGKEPTVADLYKLDKYWSMQGQLRNELQKLGELETVLLSKQFEAQWKNVYRVTEQNLVAYFNDRAEELPKLEPIVWPPDNNFSTISTYNAQQMINQVWCADGKTWSDRVWGNVEQLAEVLNEKLIESVVTGRSTDVLKKELENRFHVSYSRANTLVRTEVAHITTQAAAQRYKDYGLEKYEILGREEEDGCNHSPDCRDMDGKIFLYSEMIVGVNAPPFHPNCRCAIAPVVDIESENNMEVRKDWELDERDKERLARIYEEYPEVKENRAKIDERNKVRQQHFEERIKEIDDILAGKKSVENYSLRSHLILYNQRQRGQITSNWRNRLEKQKASDLEDLERIKYEDIFTLMDFVYCIDCGKPIPANGNKTNAVKRCPDCQAKHRKAYKAAKERERRLKKKTK